MAGPGYRTKQFTNDDDERLQPILFYLQPRLIQRCRLASSAGLPSSPPEDRTQRQEGPRPSPARVSSLAARGAPEGGSALSTARSVCPPSRGRRDSENVSSVLPWKWFLLFTYVHKKFNAVKSKPEIN